MLPPFQKVGIGVHDYDKTHLGMLDPAEFGALPAEDAGLLRHDGDVVVAAGNEVLLAAEARHPEAVDYVVRFQIDVRGHAHGKMKLVSGPEALRRVAGIVDDVPPPLIACDGDGELLAGCRLRHRTVREEACDR